MLVATDHVKSGFAAERDEPGPRALYPFTLKAALRSPHFLFRVEVDDDPAATAAHPLSNYEIANRLSYFLWSSIPDDALFASAESSRLSTSDQELGEGSSHSGQDIPIIVAGKGGGRIPQQGRLLSRTGQGNGNVLIALMQAMGVPIQSFGNGFTTPLAGLVAA